MGVLQVHLSGGEPASRRDLETITKSAHDAGLYTNLITSAVGVTQARLEALVDAGLDHVQISIQDSEPAEADRVAGYDGAYVRKVALARAVTKAGLRLTVNAVIHKHNITRIPQMIEHALELGAQRIEIAHVQYYGWAMPNRAALMPARADAFAAVAQIEELRRAYHGRIVIDAVTPDYFAKYPKALHGRLGHALAQRDAFGGACFHAMRRKPSGTRGSGTCVIIRSPKSGNRLPPSWPFAARRG